MREKNKSKVGIKRVFGYFFDKVKAKKLRFTIAILLRLVTTVTPLIGPIYIKKFIDTVSNFQGGDKSEILPILIGFVGMIVLVEGIQRLCWRVRDINTIKPWLEVMKNVYQECFDYLHKHSYRFFSNNFSGSLVKKVNKLVSGMDTFMEIMIFDFFGIALQLGILLVIVFMQNNTMGIVFGIWIIIYSIIQYLFYFKRNAKYELKANIQDSKLTGVLADSITNNFTIATFASYKKESKLFNNENKKTEKYWVQSSNIKGIIHAINDLFLILLLGISVYYSAILRSQDIISVGIVTLLWLYLFRIFDKLFNLRNVFRRFNKMIGESAEMIEILDEKWEVSDVPNAKKLKVHQGQIDFGNVDFSYGQSLENEENKKESEENNKKNKKKSGSDVFSDFNLKIKPGEKVALVGHSGSGKTTLVRLLFRFFDIQGGNINIDGQDISQVTQESLRQHISMVPQDPLLFHRTLAENIAYGTSDATMEEIIEASKKAHCHEFISTFKDGYQTKVGERGIKLSGGQRQRVAIARAILEDKKIFVMDEATSSLDSESEKLIQDALHHVFKNKTVVVIAHRLSTIMEMDRIIVLDEGKIVEEGTHTELLDKKNGQYKKLRDIQSGGFLSE